MAAAEGVVKSFDSNLLQCNGGHIICGKHWAKNFLQRMGYVKRRASTTAKVSLSEFENANLNFYSTLPLLLRWKKSLRV